MGHRVMCQAAARRTRWEESAEAVAEQGQSKDELGHGSRRPARFASSMARTRVGENGGPAARQFAEHLFQPLVAAVDTGGHY